MNDLLPVLMTAWSHATPDLARKILADLDGPSVFDQTVEALGFNPLENT